MMKIDAAKVTEHYLFKNPLFVELILHVEVTLSINIWYPISDNTLPNRK